MNEKRLLMLLALMLCLCYSHTGTAAAFERDEKEIYQDQTVSGTVVDEQGVPLPGVSIVVTGTTIGTVSDINGNYTLKVPDGSSTITFRFIGYKIISESVEGRSTIDIVLEPDVDVLNEVVVTGYGQTMNKQTVSASISTVEPKEMIEDRPIARLEQAIQGATPAVVVLQESGSPGAPLTIRMRGVGTANNAQPLTLMNGFQVPDMSHINPNDIGGIQVYQDAASAAIYGARGANGVINLQNKTGNAGETIATVSGYYGIQQLAGTGDYLTAKEFAEYYNNSIDYRIREGESIAGARPKYTDREIENLPSDTWIERVSDDAAISDLHASVATGNEKNKYYLSIGRFQQDGIIGQTSYERRTANFNIDSKLAKKLDLNLTSSYTNARREFLTENDEDNGLMRATSSIPAIYPTYDNDGNPYNFNAQTDLYYRYSPTDSMELNTISEFSNPIPFFRHVKQKYNENSLFANALLKFEITDGLKLNTSVGYFGKNYDEKSFSESFEYPTQNILNENNSLFQRSRTIRYYQYEAYLTYDKTFGPHQVSLIGGTSRLHNEQLETSRIAEALDVNSFDDANFARVSEDSEVGVFADVFSEKNTISFYGRANYNFEEKYLLGATFRVDGSSHFGPENKYGFFPSVNAGWVLSEEAFLSSYEQINMVKLRASWGKNGIDAIDPYGYVSTVHVRSPTDLQIIEENPAIKWEEVSQLNFGLDVDLLKNKIGVKVDHYYKKTEDMLVEVRIPSFVGRLDPTLNLATVNNVGWEFTGLYRDKFADFKVNVALNAGFVKNEVKDLGGAQGIEGAPTRVFGNGGNITITEEGHPIASFYGYKLQEIDNQGNPVYQDLSGPDGVPDGVITADDRTIIGNPYPDMTFGVNLNMEYKGFDFTAFMSGLMGNDVVNASQGYQVANTNRTKRVLDAWAHDNQNSNVFRSSATEVVNNEFSDYYVEDGSYARLKNVTLGYTFPKRIVEAINVRSMRLYVSANNLLTFTDYSGYDPEIGQNSDPRDVGIDRGFYPQAKSFIGGFQISF